MMSEIEVNKVNSAEQIKHQFGEVYKCDFYDETIGTEIRGPRPVVIISTKWYNEESDRITILPLTRLFNKLRQPKKVYAWEVRVRVNNQEGKVMTDQMHNLDKQRLKEKIGELPPEIMAEIMKQLRMLINLFPNKLSKLEFINCPSLTEIYCTDGKLEDLVITNCPRIKILQCGINKLVSLDVENLSDLQEIHCVNNKLNSLDFLNQLSSPEKMTSLFLENNDFPPQDLEVFRRFTNLTYLTLYKNRFYGSLEPLKDLTKLEVLTIDDTDIDSGLEYLPGSLEKIEAPWPYLSSSDERKVKKIWTELKNYKEGDNYNLKRWREDNQKFKKEKKSVEEQLENLKIKEQVVEVEQPPK